MTLSIAAVLVAVLLFSALSAVTHALAWGGRAPMGDPGQVLVGYKESPNVELSSEKHITVTTGTAHPGHVVAKKRPVLVPLIVMLAALLLSILYGGIFPFLNLSSHHALYAARLARAYLGATNPERKKGPWISVREVHPKDDVPHQHYRPDASGGPLHILNVTINETVPGDSQVEYRDRKGVPMAVGPVGVSIGARHHTLWTDREGNAAVDAKGKVNPAHDAEPILRPIKDSLKPNDSVAQALHTLLSNKEKLVSLEARTLGEWMAISGAAFTTGLGYRTSLGASFLLGLSNIRLGYWWDSSIVEFDPVPSPPERVGASVSSRFRRYFCVQRYLMSELLARFYGTSRRHWYLSDGGHFENSACYELIRRRLPRIICCDCGTDPEYKWEDLANLARKVRIDFNAEMTFVRPEEVNHVGWIPLGLQKKVGPPLRIRNTSDPLAGDDAARLVHATIARVYYMNDPKQKTAFYRRGAPWGSTILFLKPSLNGNEPLDIREYANSHPDFPHESTLEQNFNEAQWESYRKLGEHIAGEVIAGFEHDPWWKGRCKSLRSSALRSSRAHEQNLTAGKHANRS